MPIIRKVAPPRPLTDEELERDRKLAHVKLHLDAFARLNASGWYHHQPDGISRFKCRVCAAYLDRVPSCTYCDENGNMTRFQYVTFGKAVPVEPTRELMRAMNLAERLRIPVKCR